MLHDLQIVPDTSRSPYHRELHFIVQGGDFIILQTLFDLFTECKVVEPYLIHAEVLLEAIYCYCICRILFT